jgi:alanyl-tRNA synthetase
VAEKSAALAKRVKELESGGTRLKNAVSDDLIASLIGDAVDAAGYRMIAAAVGQLSAVEMRGLWDVLRARGADAVVLVGADVESSKSVFLAAGDAKAVDAGFDAGAVVRAIAQEVGGRGGGKPAMAQGGSDDSSRIDDALRAARRALGVE